MDAVRNEILLNHATEIVAAYVNNNTVAREDLPALIQQIYKTLAHVDGPGATVSSERPQPAVPSIRIS